MSNGQVSYTFYMFYTVRILSHGTCTSPYLKMILTAL